MGTWTTSSVSAERHTSQWFPPWFVWALFFLTSAVRVFYVIQPQNWWILHPDEIFQTMEVAHGEMYGYGFRTYEFNRAPELGPLTPDIRKQEQGHGMFALRSFLVPHAYVTVDWLLQTLGVHFTPFTAWRVAHTLVASTLVLAVHRYVIALFRSRDVACLAAVLCATCCQLHVLGTHTLVNSLIAPFVFLALAHVHRLLHPPQDGGPSETHGTEDSREAAKNAATTSSSASGSALHHHDHHQQRSVDSQNSISQILPSSRNSTSKGKGKQRTQKNGLASQRQGVPSSLPTGNATAGAFVDLNGVQQSDESKTEPKSERNGKQTAHRFSFRYTNGRHQGKSLTNGNGKSAMNGEGQLNDCRDSSGSESCHESLGARTALSNVAAGFVLGVCVYVRIDVAALAVASLLPHWSPFRTRYVDVIVSACGALCGLAVGVAEDFRVYGWGVLTPYQWFKFNVQQDYSSALFGKSGAHKYFVDIFLQNAGMMALTAASVMCLLWLCYDSTFGHRSDNSVSGHFHKKRASVSSGRPSLESQHDSHVNTGVIFRSCVSWGLLLLLYSSKGHKELRFVHNVIVLVLVTCAALVQSALSRLGTRLSHWSRVGLLFAGVASFAVSQWQDVSGLTQGSRNKFAFKGTGDSQYVNQCLHYVSTRSDVTGVFIDRNLYATGGYTLLHRDVPVFCIVTNNFQEYLKRDRLREAPRSFLSPHSNLSLSFLGKYSDYVTFDHSRQAMKLVLRARRYNYLVVSVSHDFRQFGLGDPVFRSGMFEVYRRPTKPTTQQKLILERILSATLTFDPHVLLHEADMLMYYGVWARAAERFEHVLSLDPDQIGAYLPLASSYHKMEDFARSRQTLSRCYERFSEDRCNARRSPVAAETVGGVIK